MVNVEVPVTPDAASPPGVEVVVVLAGVVGRLPLLLDLRPVVLVRPEKRFRHLIQAIIILITD